MSEARRVRDPIHGFIPLSSDEAEIVETPVFQRLRGIRQLAFANLVYPGALHTRFDHTLGVFHVTSLLCKVFGALRRNVWNPAPIDSCPAISWRQRDSDSL
jgi:HD superfamily phosphohydrolase